MSTIVFSPTLWAVNKTGTALSIRLDDSPIKKGIISTARFVISSALIATGLIELISYIALTIITSPASIFKETAPIYNKMKNRLLEVAKATARAFMETVGLISRKKAEEPTSPDKVSYFTYITKWARTSASDKFISLKNRVSNASKIEISIALLITAATIIIIREVYWQSEILNSIETENQLIKIINDRDTEIKGLNTETLTCSHKLEGITLANTYNVEMSKILENKYSYLGALCGDLRASFQEHTDTWFRYHCQCYYDHEHSEHLKTSNFALCMLLSDPSYRR